MLATGLLHNLEFSPDLTDLWRSSERSFEKITKTLSEVERSTKLQSSVGSHSEAMATAKHAIKESLLGTIREPELSQQTKATFDRNARQDEATGEYYMTEEDFVNAIAPANEDYVSFRLSFPNPEIGWQRYLFSTDLAVNRSTK